MTTTLVYEKNIITTRLVFLPNTSTHYQKVLASLFPYGHKDILPRKSESNQQTRCIRRKVQAPVPLDRRQRSLCLSAGSGYAPKVVQPVLFHGVR